MINRIIELLSERGISVSAQISLKNCIITRKYKLEKAGFSDIDGLSAVVFAIPYLTPQSDGNISSYAIPRDYHAFSKQLFADVLPYLEREFPCNRFVGFADDSPIDECHAAARAGIGMIGKNQMLITEKYSSFVFLGEIITDIPFEGDVCEIKSCRGCGACLRACPMTESGECLSSLTQKKGELTESEREIIKKYGSAWGCDICQEVCPHTADAIKAGTVYTDIEFFKNDAIPYLTSEIVDKMTDEEFAARAYSWRGRRTIVRNLEILEKE
jgi:epoxyqueuosine reductase QueG